MLPFASTAPAALTAVTVLFPVAAQRSSLAPVASSLGRARLWKQFGRWPQCTRIPPAPRLPPPRVLSEELDGPGPRSEVSPALPGRSWPSWSPGGALASVGKPHSQGWAGPTHLPGSRHLSPWPRGQPRLRCRYKGSDGRPHNRPFSRTVLGAGVGDAGASGWVLGGPSSLAGAALSSGVASSHKGTNPILGLHPRHLT